MIKLDHGRVTINGTIIELCADVVTAYAAVLDAMPKDDDIQKGISTTLIKSLFYDMASRTNSKGFDVHYTDEEVTEFEKLWGATYD